MFVAVLVGGTVTAGGGLDGTPDGQRSVVDHHPVRVCIDLSRLGGVPWRRAPPVLPSAAASPDAATSPVAPACCNNGDGRGDPATGEPTVVEIIRRYTDWPVDVAIRIARCEGSLMLYPDDNGSSVGPMQVEATAHMSDLSAVIGFPVTDLGMALSLLRQPSVNIAVAHAIWLKDGGFFAWSCN